MTYRYSFEFEEVCGYYVAIAASDGSENYKKMIRLNETGKRILELLQTGKTEKEVLALLGDEYNATEDTLVNAIKNVKNKLEIEGLIVR